MKSRVVYTPRERKKYKKSSRINKKVVLIMVIALVFIGGCIYSTYLPVLQLNHITISGNKTLPEELVKKKVGEVLNGKYALVLPRRFVLFSFSNQVAPLLEEAFPIIQAIDVKKRYPDSLDIQITERKLFAIVCNDLITDEGISASSTPVVENGTTPRVIQCMYIDNKGFSYEEAPNSSGTLIARIQTDAESLKMSSELIKPSFVATLEYIIKKIPEVTGDRVLDIELPSKLVSEFRVKTSGGYRLFFKREDDFDNALRVLKAVLNDGIKDKKSRLEYVDLRFGNKVFYKLK